MGVIVLSVLALGYTVNPMIITVFVAIIAPIATYELIHNVAKIKSKAAIIAAMLYTAIVVVNFALDCFKISNHLDLSPCVTSLHLCLFEFTRKEFS